MNKETNTNLERWDEYVAMLHEKHPDTVLYSSDPKEAEEENGNDGYSLATEYQMKLDARAARKAELERKSAEAAAKRKTKAKSN